MLTLLSLELLRCDRPSMLPAEGAAAAPVVLVAWRPCERVPPWYCGGVAGGAMTK